MHAHTHTHTHTHTHKVSPLFFAIMGVLVNMTTLLPGPSLSTLIFAHFLFLFLGRSFLVFLFFAGLKVIDCISLSVLLKNYAHICVRVIA